MATKKVVDDLKKMVSLVRSRLQAKSNGKKLAAAMKRTNKPKGTAIGEPLTMTKPPNLKRKTAPTRRRESQIKGQKNTVSSKSAPLRPR